MRIKPYQVHQHVTEGFFVDIRRIFGIFVEYRLRGGAGEIFVLKEDLFKEHFIFVESNEPVELRDDPEGEEVK
jgi:hypothetical protein